MIYISHYSAYIIISCQPSPYTDIVSNSECNTALCSPHENTAVVITIYDRIHKANIVYIRSFNISK